MFPTPQNPSRLVQDSIQWTATAVICAKLFLWIGRKIQAWYLLRPIPGPTGVFGLGSIPEILRNIHRLFDYYEQYCDIYGDTYRFPVSIFSTGIIVTKNPANVKHILSDSFNNYLKPPELQDAFREVLGKAIFSMNHAHFGEEGKLWRLQRKMVARVLSTNQFRKYSKSVFQQYASEALAGLVSASETQNVVNLQKLFADYTAKCTYHIGFGINLCENPAHGKFKENVEFACELSVHRMNKPWYKWFGWCMKSEYQLKETVSEIDAIIQTIIEQRLADTPEELASKSDMLSSFLRSQLESQEKFSFKSVRDILVGILMAGNDTTNSLTTWCMYHILANPWVHQKLLKEIDSALVNAEPTYDDLKSMVYLDWVVQESLRISPPVPVEMKYSFADDTLPDGTFVPAKTPIMFCPYTMGRDESRWRDAKTFLPERWGEMTTRPSAYELPTFQGGPRICLGQQIALLEAKILLCRILQKFDIELIRKEVPEYQTNASLIMKGGLPVRVKERTVFSY